MRVTDCSTTPRKPYTPTQRLALFESERGICCICGLKIIGRFIDEHKRALGLGGSNDPKNRGVAHPKCADIKTHDEDMPRINKAKAQKKAQHAIRVAPARPIVSAPLATTERAAKRVAKEPLPPRQMFKD